jgi:hypothetical protein
MALFASGSIWDVSSSINMNKESKYMQSTRVKQLFMSKKYSKFSSIKMEEYSLLAY